MTARDLPVTPSLLKVGVDPYDFPVLPPGDDIWNVTAPTPNNDAFSCSESFETQWGGSSALPLLVASGGKSVGIEYIDGTTAGGSSSPYGAGLTTASNGDGLGWIYSTAFARTGTYSVKAETISSPTTSQDNPDLIHIVQNTFDIGGTTYWYTHYLTSGDEVSVEWWGYLTTALSTGQNTVTIYLYSTDFTFVKSTGASEQITGPSTWKGSTFSYTSTGDLYALVGVGTYEQNFGQSWTDDICVTLTTST